MFIVGHRETKKLVQLSGLYHSANPSEEIILKNMVTQFGGGAQDYSVHFIEDESPLAQELLLPVKFNLVWTGQDVTGVDMTPERQKSVLKVTADQDVLIIGESIVFTGTLYDKDMIKLPYSGQDVIEIGTPYGKLKIRVTFDDGKCIHKFTPRDYGTYSVPLDSQFCNDYKVAEQCIFEIIYDAVPLHSMD